MSKREDRKTQNQSKNELKEVSIIGVPNNESGNTNTQNPN